MKDSSTQFSLKSFKARELKLFSKEVYSDIMHLYHKTEYLSVISPVLRHQISPNGIPSKIFKALWVFLKDAYILAFAKEFKPKKQVAVFVSSKNNADAVKFLSSKENFELIKIGRKKLPIPVSGTMVFKYKFFYDLLFPLFFFRYYKKPVSNDMRNSWECCFQAMGLYEEALRWIQKNRPKAIVLSNDHSFEQRAILNAAKDLGVQTIYIQHAAVSEYFPPLKFSLSLLEGQDTLHKYQQIGPIEGQYRLTGMARFTPYVKLRKLQNERVINSVALCFNVYDHLNDVLSIAKKLNDVFHQVVIRHHPAEKRKLDCFKDFLISDSKQEDNFNFLTKVDCIVAGDSSIHLEATMLNLPSVYFQFTKRENRDYYGFVKNRLIPEAHDLPHLIQLLSDPEYLVQNHFHRAKYYNHAINTSYEDSVDVRMEKEIDSFVEN